MKKFRVGDWVRVTDKVISYFKVHVGKIFQIEKITSYYRIIINNEDYLFKECELELAYQFNIGDEVQIPWSAEMLRKGIYTISKLPHDNCGYYLLKDKNSSYEGSFSESGIVKYVAPPQPKFKIGDTVRVANYTYLNGISGIINFVTINDSYWGGNTSYFILCKSGHSYCFPEQCLELSEKDEIIKIPARKNSTCDKLVQVPLEDLQEIMKLNSPWYTTPEIMNRWYNVTKQ